MTSERRVRLRRGADTLSAMYGVDCRRDPARRRAATPRRISRWIASLATSALAVTPLTSFATENDGPERSWTLQVDDDFLALTQRDRDYTVGVAFTLAGERPGARALPLAGALHWIDDVTRFRRFGSDPATARQALTLGLQVFTPRDLEAEEPLPDDRPYATLAYVTGSSLALDADRNVALQSSLTLGLLGVPVVGELHRSVHVLIGSPLPNGYAHQISNGGEATFRYALSRERLLASARHGQRPYSVRFGFGGSIGYITEASAELAYRSGPMRVPWWSTPPVSADYAGQPPIAAPDPAAAARAGVVFEAGIEARARFYNSFLQGQFRSSDVTYSYDELEHALLEAWLGFAMTLKSGLAMSYTIRAQTPDIAHGPAARSLTWGSLSFTRRF